MPWQSGYWYVHDKMMTWSEKGSKLSYGEVLPDDKKKQTDKKSDTSFDV